MRFPELNIIKEVKNIDKIGDYKKLLLCQLDWSSLDEYKKSKHISWIYNFVEIKNKFDTKAINQIIDEEINWREYNYPTFYKSVYEEFELEIHNEINPQENKALDGYMEDDSPKVTDFIWTEKANNRLELVPKGFMRDNTRGRVMAYARSNGMKEITLEVCEAGIKDSVKMMEEAIANGATLEDFLPKKVGA